MGTIQVGNKETKEYHEYFRAMTEKDDMPLSLLVNNVITSEAEGRASFL